MTRPRIAPDLRARTRLKPDFRTATAGQDILADSILLTAILSFRPPLAPR